MTGSTSTLTASHLPATRRQAFTVVLAIELWERFGYYGMQAALTIFMVGQLRMSDTAANLLMGALAAFTYITPLLGGLIGDRLLGARPAMVLGAVSLAAGYALLAVSLGSPQFFLIAMALIAAGNGLFKPNAGNLVRRIYEGDNAALDAAFTLYYMAVNVGSAVSMLLTPWLQDNYGAPVAFGACSVGLIIGLVYYLWRARWLSQTIAANETSSMQWGRLGLVVAGMVVVTAVIAWILGNAALARTCVITAGVVLILGWAVLYVQAPAQERPGLRLTYLLSIQTMFYLAFYQQMMTSLTLFALRAVSGDYEIAGVTLFHLSAGQFQALNSIWIMILSPILAVLYNRLGAKERDISLPRKMLLGYLFAAAAFAIWWVASITAHGLVSPWIMVVGYGLLSTAELLTNGLGLAVIARYAPARLSGFLMGGLYLLWGISMYVGSIIANEAAMPSDMVSSVGPAFYAPLFRTLFATAVGIVIALACLEPLARRWAEEHANVMIGKG